MEILKQILSQIMIIKTITTIEYNNNDTSKKNNRSDNNEKNNNNDIRLFCIEPINSKNDRN